MRVHLFEGGTRRKIHQGKGHNRRGNYRRRPGKHDRGAEVQEKFSEWTIVPKQEQKEKTHYGWRQDERQKKESTHICHRRPGSAFPPRRRRDPCHEREKRCRHTRGKRDPDRR